MRRRFFFVKQQDERDCGAACIASITAYYGLKIPLAQVREFTATDRKGTTILGLVEAAEKLGFQAKGVRGTLDSLRDVPTPFIARIDKPGVGFHYVVVYNIGKKHVHIGDPAQGIVKVTLADFLNQWTNILVLISPAENFAPADHTESNLRRFWHLIRPHSSLLAEAFVAAIVYTVLGVLTAFYVGTLLDSVFPNGDERLLHILSAGMLLLIVLRAFFGWTRRLLLLMVAQKIDASLILGYYKHILNLPQSFFDARRVGEIISRVNDAVKIRTAVSGATLTILVDSLMIVFAFAVLLLYSAKLALLVACVFPGFVMVFMLLRGPIRRTQRSLMERSAELQAQFTSSINGVETIKAVSAENYSNLKTELIFTRILRLMDSATKQNMFNSTAAELLSSIAVVTLFWFGGLLVFQGDISLGELVASFTLLGYLTAPLARLVNVHQNVQDALIAADRLYEILAIETEDKHNELKIKLDVDKVNGEILIDGCSFRYGARADVINKLSFSIPAGKITAIVGESGSGKSTILKLLQKMYSVREGKILLDGVDLRDIEVHSLRQVLGVVPQHIELFHGTVLENVAYGESQPRVQRVMEVCSLVGADAFINDLPHRYNSLLGEHGATISGGQRQRLAIARALYKDPRVLLLDEATSNLDSAAEAAIQKLLSLLKFQNMTIVLVAHRLSTVMRADQVVVVEKGAVAEFGTHKELLQMRGKYFDMWNRQIPFNSFSDLLTES